MARPSRWSHAIELTLLRQKMYKTNTAVSGINYKFNVYTQFLLFVFKSLQKKLIHICTYICSGPPYCGLYEWPEAVHRCLFINKNIWFFFRTRVFLSIAFDISFAHRKSLSPSSQLPLPSQQHQPYLARNSPDDSATGWQTQWPTIVIRIPGRYPRPPLCRQGSVFISTSDVRLMSIWWEASAENEFRWDAQLLNHSNWSNRNPNAFLYGLAVSVKSIYSAVALLWKSIHTILTKIFKSSARVGDSRKTRERHHR